MDSQSTPEAASDTEARLVEFVSANRQHLPPLPKRVDAVEIAVSSPDIIAEREARYARRQEDRRRAEVHERFGELVRSAGARYRVCTLENFECHHAQHKAVLANVLAYVAADCPENLILYGPVGTGKDHLAFAVCREAIRSGKTVRWINGQNWFGAVRDAMDTDKSEASLIAELVRPDLLCLSDPLPPVGALTQFQATMLYRLIDARYSRGVPTVCTLNVANDAEADDRIGVATWDRLCHGAYKLRCQWPSYRTPRVEA